jgi:hypothetical protein
VSLGLPNSSPRSAGRSRRGLPPEDDHARLTGFAYARPSIEERHIPAAETLLVIDIVNAHGKLILQTIWATTADLRAGHRRTDSESVADATRLMCRLAELAPELYAPVTLAAAG